MNPFAPGNWSAPYRAARVEGHSMRPTIPLGSEVLLERVEPEALRPGDIVAFAAGFRPGDDFPHEPHLVLHRLLRREADGRLASQGDGCAQPDAPWSTSALVGRVAGWRSDARAPWRRPRKLVGMLLRLTMRLGLPRVGLRLRRGLGLVAWGGAQSHEAAAGPLGAEPEQKLAEAGRQRQFEGDANDRAAQAGAEPGSPVDVQKLGDQWVVYEKKTGSMHVLNAVASLIWQYRSEGLDDESVVLKLRQHFPEVSLATLREDVARTATHSLPNLPKEMASPRASGKRAR